MNGELTYIADCIIIEALGKGEIQKTAQDSFLATIVNHIKSFISDQYDAEHPLASIAAFFAPEILWALPFGGWLSVLYTVAEALGFDWKPFWTSVGNGIVSIVKSILSIRETNPSYQAPPEQVSQQVNNVVSEAFDAHFTGEEDTAKLLEIAKQKVSTSFKKDLNDALEVKAIAHSLERDPIVKEALLGRLFKRKLSGFFIRLISWIAKTALISLGFASGAALLSGITGQPLKQDKEDTTGGGSQISKEQLKAPKLEMSPSVPRSLFEVHRNDTGAIWIEKGNIENVEDYLLSWTLNAYPQLAKDKDKLRSSSGFQSVVSAFRARNSFASGTGLIAMPKPFQRKIDIVSAIVNNYTKSE
jgi:hypothetical protein